MNAVIAKAIVEEFDYIECIDRLVTIAEPPQGLLARASVAFGRSGAGTPPADGSRISEKCQIIGRAGVRSVDCIT